MTETDFNGIALRAQAWGLALTDEHDEQIDALFEDSGIGSHRGGDVLAVAFDEGIVIGALTECNGDEWSIAVDEGFRGNGIATALVKAVIAEGASGFVVAGTDEGAAFIFSLRHSLSDEERESLDAPAWEGIESE